MTLLLLQLLLYYGNITTTAIYITTPLPLDYYHSSGQDRTKKRARLTLRDSPMPLPPQNACLQYH